MTPARQSWHRIAWATVTLLTLEARGDDDGELPLPKWQSHELDAMRANPNLPPVLGSLLGGMDELADAPAAVPLLLGETGENLGDSPEKSQPTTDLSRFLPPSLLAGSRTHPAPLPNPSPMVSLADVPPGYLQACEEKPAGTRLLDPNHELSETAVEDFERFLNFHANDSRIPLTLVLLGRSQKLSERANLAAFASGSASKGTSALLLCPYGEPWRARLFVSQLIRDKVPPGDLTNLLETSVQEAQRATDPDEQLHRLLVQLSIRLFWIQRMLPSSPPPVTQASAIVAESPSAAMEEVTQGHGPSPARPSRLAKLQAISIAIMIALLLYGGWRWRRFKMRHFEWLLPPAPVPPVPRFGGAACGGGASIHYR